MPDWPDWGGQQISFDALHTHLAEAGKRAGLSEQEWRREWAVASGRLIRMDQMAVGRPYVIEIPEWGRDGERMHWLIYSKDATGSPLLFDVGPCGWYVREYARVRQVMGAPGA